MQFDGFFFCLVSLLQYAVSSFYLNTKTQNRGACVGDMSIIIDTKDEDEWDPVFRVWKKNKIEQISFDPPL